MKKKFVLMFMAVLMALVGMAQEEHERPKWTYDRHLPNPTYNSYFLMQSAEGYNETDARNKAIGRVYQKIAAKIRQPINSQEIQKAASGEQFTVISQDYSIPVEIVCEYVETPRYGDRRKVYFLCQVANAGYNNLSHYNIRCRDHYQDWSALGWSALYPGIGHFYKRRPFGGIIFVTTETAALGSSVYCYIKEQEQWKIMRQTEVGLEDYLQAKADYEKWNQYKTLSLIGAAAIYGINLITAYVVPTKQLQWLSFYPSIVPTNNGEMAYGATLTFQF